MPGFVLSVITSCHDGHVGWTWVWNIAMIWRFVFLRDDTNSTSYGYNALNYFSAGPSILESLGGFIRVHFSNTTKVRVQVSYILDNQVSLM